MTPLVQAVNPVGGMSALLPKGDKLAPQGGPGFGDVLLQELKSASALGKESGRLTKAFTMEDSTVSLEETMIAGTKSGIAFQATLTARTNLYKPTLTL